MKIEVAKPELEAALQVASIGAAPSGGDITAHFLFRQGSGGTAEVLTSNNRIGVSMPLRCDASVGGDEDPMFTIQSKRLKEWVKGVDGVLNLSFEDGVVSATCSLGSVKYQSLDPAQFPDWDEALTQTPEGVKIAAKRLHMALTHARRFISDKDTTTPKLAVTEIRKGSLQATDKGALAVVTIEELADSNLRIHGKDLGHVLAFLSASGDGSVEIREHERCLFLIRDDGGVLSVGRPHHAFPEIALDKKPDDPYYWNLRADEVRNAIKILGSAANEDDTRLRFSRKGGNVGLSMASAAAARQEPLSLELQEHGSMDDPEVPMPEEGFEIAYPYLQRLLGDYQSEVIRFGLNPQKDKATGKQRGGWVRFREDRDGDDYLMLLVWLL